MRIGYHTALALTMSIAIARSFNFVLRSNIAMTSRLGGVALMSYTGPGADTVVSTCTQKITDLLKPVKLKVTSSNDDPNGSHVRINFCLLDEPRMYHEKKIIFCLQYFLDSSGVYFRSIYWKEYRTTSATSVQSYLGRVEWTSSCCRFNNCEK